MSTHQKICLNVSGMHCQSCCLLIDDELRTLPHVDTAKANLQNQQVEIIGRFADRATDQIIDELNAVLTRHGYSLSLRPVAKNIAWSDFQIAIPVAIGFAILFVALQKVGLVNLVNADKVNYGTAFVIGIIASLSTCMAIVGGLLLSMSATFAKEGDKIRPQLMFHGGRIVSFFIFGGVIGALGSTFTINTMANFILSLVIGLVMLILGVNLLDIFPWAKKFQPAMPKFIANHAHGVAKLNHTLTPLLVGIATFFLPCGFTQSMQLYTLTTGDFLTGGLTMLTFALGTLPVLALISFSSFSIRENKYAGVFFKSAGLIVVVFAVFNLINSLAAIGLIRPVFNF